MLKMLKIKVRLTSRSSTWSIREQRGGEGDGGQNLHPLLLSLLLSFLAVFHMLLNMAAAGPVGSPLCASICC